MGRQSYMWGWFATHWACCGDQSSALAVLLDADTSIDARNDAGQTLLMVAAMYGGTTCATLLMARLGGDGVEEHLEMVDEHGDSAAHLASWFDEPSMLALLLDSGASMDARNNAGQTLLMAAARHGAIDCVNLLFARLGDGLGEHLGMADNDGHSAAHLASSANRPSMLALLFDAGVPMTVRDDLGRNLLMAAAETGAMDSITMLLAGVGVDLDAQQSDGYTALYLAVFRHSPAVSLLLHAGVLTPRSPTTLAEPPSRRRVPPDTRSAWTSSRPRSSSPSALACSSRPAALSPPAASPWPPPPLSPARACPPCCARTSPPWPGRPTCLWVAWRRRKSCRGSPFNPTTTTTRRRKGVRRKLLHVCG